MKKIRFAALGKKMMTNKKIGGPIFAYPVN